MNTFVRQIIKYVSYVSSSLDLFSYNVNNNSVQLFSIARKQTTLHLIQIESTRFNKCETVLVGGQVRGSTNVKLSSWVGKYEVQQM